MSLMVRNAALVFLVVLLTTVIVAAQTEDNWPPLSYLRSDYRRASVVARVQVRKAEIVNRIGGYEDWHLTGEVIEPFKDRFRKGDTIDFYHGAEKGFREETFLGDKIGFLFRNFVEKEKRWVWAVLENSTLGYTADRGKKLRLIQRSVRRKPRAAKRSSRAVRPAPQKSQVESLTRSLPVGVLCRSSSPHVARQS